ncbi:MAG: MnhB domain-containing protein [Candidatus Izemoplasmatales bacterium]|jgi:multicomponent Na+:H+ antiporter subunit B|nr:MnhB domain-containing protein [Candidatus Izemoplasmatales bacterium]MDY0011106.1 MnhB domain-containing protein [Candidatus Izemoplasmatales bacterium]
MNDIIIKNITRIVIPFAQIYGIFVILNGHVSPGGGFAGGAIIGTSLILYTLVFGREKGRKKFSHKASEIAETGGILIYVIVGLIGLVVAGRFLTNLGAGFPEGVIGNIISGGMIPILMIGIGIKVASTMISLFNLLIDEAI